MSVRAKFKCEKREEQTYNNEVNCVRVTFFPVYCGEPGTENYTFWKSTPSGYVEIYINNPAAFNQFKVGKEYYLDFTEAEV